MTKTSKLIEYEQALKDQFRVVNTPILRLLEELSNPEKPTFIAKTEDNSDVILHQGDVIALPPRRDPTFLLVITVYESTGFVFYDLTQGTYRFYGSKRFMGDYEGTETTIIHNPFEITRNRPTYNSQKDGVIGSPKEELLSRHEEKDIPPMEELPEADSSNDNSGLYVACLDKELRQGDVFMINNEFRFVLNTEENKGLKISTNEPGVVNYNLTKNHFSFYPSRLFATDNEQSNVSVITDPWDLRV